MQGISNTSIGQNRVFPDQLAMHTDLGCARVRLPTLAFGRWARLHFDAEHARPEAPSALCIVSGELDQ